MYYTDNEVRELLEQAFQEGYDNGIDDTLDYIDENYELEDDSFDLEDEYSVYAEVTREQDHKEVQAIKAKAKQDEGESDEDFQRRRSNIVRRAVATRAAKANTDLSNLMDGMRSKLHTTPARKLAEFKAGASNIAAQRSQKSANRYAYQVSKDAEHRAVKNAIRDFKNS